MEGAFSTRVGGAPVESESWSLSPAQGGVCLQASGAVLHGRKRRWRLDARVTAEGRIDTLEWQLTAEPPPTEVTTIAARTHKDRVFITRIPPGGVPERVETSFPGGSLIVGPSLSLVGLMAGVDPPKPGMGRRAVFVRVDPADLSVRLEDGIVLGAGRSRGVGADGKPGWVRKIELRTALSAGRAELVLATDAHGAVLGAEWPQAVPARSASLDGFEP